MWYNAVVKISYNKSWDSTHSIFKKQFLNFSFEIPSYQKKFAEFIFAFGLCQKNFTEFNYENLFGKKFREIFFCRNFFLIKFQTKVRYFLFFIRDIIICVYIETHQILNIIKYFEATLSLKLQFFLSTLRLYWKTEWLTIKNIYKFVKKNLINIKINKIKHKR